MAISPPTYTFTPGSVAQSGQVNTNFSVQYANDQSLQTQITAVGNAAIFPPQGRLTLTSMAPVLSANVTNAGTVYYTPYVGAIVPVYNGTGTGLYSFTEQSLILDASDHLSGKLYDVFCYQVASAVSVGTGPAWTNATTRSAAISRVNGLYVNSAPISLINSSTPTAVTTNQATYLGTIYCNGNAQVSMNMTPAAASGGSNNILGVYNAYNRVGVTAVCLDSTAGQFQTTINNTWQTLNASTSDRITFIDGLQQSTLFPTLQVGWNSPIGGTVSGMIGVNLDATSGSPAIVSGAISAGAQAPGGFMSVNPSFLPQFGLHYVQAMFLSNQTNAFNFSVFNPGIGIFAGQVGFLSLRMDL